MSRRSLQLATAFGIAAMASPLCAQEALEAQSGEPPESIDILVEPEDLAGPLEDCSKDQEAAIISGEIVVCRRRNTRTDQQYDGEGARRRHAEETMHQNDPQAPDLFGIPNHGTVVARGCFIPPCPPPPVTLIDLEAIPEAPPGSDADRIGRGLAPRGYDTSPDGSVRVAGERYVQGNAEELGLPPVPGEVSPSGSASPEAEPSG